jgi:hypothetical protein
MGIGRVIDVTITANNQDKSKIMIRTRLGEHTCSE